MGERKGVNKYYPPDYDPAKGGLNAYHGTHALRERARKLHEGILIIRFEMPYNIWCNGCGKHIGMGVRYNAQKRKMGNYYTTPIYKFRMKCHLCDQHFEIQTDPKNCDYQILSGCRRKEERWDTEKAGNVQTTHREVKEKLMTNAMYKLEHGASDQIKTKKLAPTLTRLEEIRDDWKDDFAINQLLRKQFRTDKKEIEKQKASDDSFKERKNLPVELNLLQESQGDKEKASQIRFGEDFSTPDILKSLRKRKIKQSSIFGSSNDTKIELAKTLHSTQSAKLNKNATTGNMDTKVLTTNIIGIKLKRKTKHDSTSVKRNSVTETHTSNDPTGESNSISSPNCSRVDVSTNLEKTPSPTKHSRTVPFDENETSNSNTSILVDYNSSSSNSSDSNS